MDTASYMYTTKYLAGALKRLENIILFCIWFARVKWQIYLVEANVPREL